MKPRSRIIFQRPSGTWNVHYQWNNDKEFHQSCYAYKSRFKTKDAAIAAMIKYDIGCKMEPPVLIGTLL